MLITTFEQQILTWEKSSSVICDQRTPRLDTASVVFSVEKSISALVWHNLTPKTALGFNMAIKALRDPSVVFVWFCRHKDGKIVSSFYY